MNNQLWILLFSIQLVGCAAGPDYIKRAPPAPAAWSNTAGMVSHAEDISRWWQRLNDPLLTELIEEALRNSPDMRSAQAKLRESRARIDLADANRAPTIKGSLSGSKSKSGTSQSNNLFKGGFDASWEPDIFGGQRRAHEAANADAGITLANLHNTQVSLAAEVALNYVQLRSYQARLKIARNNLATQNETLQITVWREQAGLVTSLDKEQAHTSLLQVQAGIPTLNTNLIKAENRLAILLGKFPATLHERLSAPATLSTLPDEIALGIPADTLRQRPDVQAAERKLAAETARSGQTAASRYPSFSLSGSLGWQSATLSTLGATESFTRSITGSIAQTIFDGGRVRSNIKAQNAVQEQAQIAYEKVVLIALEEVENALAAYANSRERQTALQLAATSARNAAQLAGQRYTSGLIDFPSLLDTERTQLSNADNLASAELDELSAFISLYKALGGGWENSSEATTNKTEGGHP